MSEDADSRRDFLSSAAKVAMTGGLVAGYGTCAAMGGRFLFPAEDAPRPAWHVSDPPVEVVFHIVREASAKRGDDPRVIGRCPPQPGEGLDNRSAGSA